MKSEFNPLELKKINVILQKRIELKHRAKSTKDMMVKHPLGLATLPWWKKISRLF